MESIDFASGQTLNVAFAGPDLDTPELKMRANFVGTEGRVIDTHPEHDIALIEVEGAASLTFRVQLGDRVIETAPAAAVLNPAKLREGVELAVSGYPLNAPSLVTNAGILASSFDPQNGPAGYQNRYLGDFTANPGNSGGPVYTVKDATVVGVCVAGRLAPIVGGVGAHASGLTVIVPVSEAIKIMERNGLFPAAATRVVPPKTNYKKKRR